MLGAARKTSEQGVSDSGRARIGVQARDIEVAYRATQPVISGLSHDFAPGSLTAITGPSGRGKSTLLYALGLLIAPTSGSIILGTTATEILTDRQRSHLRARTIGFLFQDAHLDPRRTVLENIVEGCFYSGRAAVESRRQGLRLMAQLDVDVPSGRRPGQISGGQAARIALARALVKSPSLLLADEPTGNLDAATAHLVLRELRRAADAGAVVVVATHDDAVRSACERVVAL